MRLLPTAVLIAGALILTGAHVEAQSLAEAAAKEKARRAQKAGKVFTEEDLRRAGSSGRASVVTGEPAGGTAAEGGSAEGTEGAPAEGTEGAAPADETVSTAPKKAEKSQAELREEKQKEWRGRLEKAQAELAQASYEITRIQGLIQALSPESTAALAGFNARLKEQQDKAANARQNIDTIETEGRHNGFR